MGRGTGSREERDRLGRLSWWPPQFPQQRFSKVKWINSVRLSHNACRKPKFQDSTLDLLNPKLTCSLKL